MTDVETDPRVGTTLLGRLRVARVLGAGGMGVVYEVEHLVTGHRRALKVLHHDKSDDPKAVARLLREASIAGRVKSRCLVDTYDVGVLEDGAPYLLMELLEGRTLAARLDAEGVLSPAEAIRIGEQIAKGLAAAHAAGVLHRDLTPKNVFLVREGALEHVRIVDFGLSKMVRGKTDRFGHLTGTGAFVGTPFYVSPEQAAGDPVDARADQYSLAVILYECLAGTPPFGGASLLEVLGRIASGEHTPLRLVRPEVGPSISAAISRALSRDPADRFADVGQLVAALSFEFQETAPLLRAAPAMSAIPVTQPRVIRRATPAPSAPTARRRSLGTWIAAVAGAGLLAALLAFGATAWVLHARRARAVPHAVPAPAPEPAGPELLARLHALYRAERYRDCVAVAMESSRAVEALDLALGCAEQGNLADEAQLVCEELNRRSPTHPRAQQCRRMLRRYARGLGGTVDPAEE